MKVKGGELALWMEEAWPGDDWFWDHDIFEEPDVDATYDTDDIGAICYQGRGQDPTGGDGYSLATLIKKWRKGRSFDVLVVEVPKDRTDEFRATLSSFGAKLARS